MKKLTFTHYTRPEESYHVSRSHVLNSKPFPLHIHDYVEIFWLEQGEGVHLINGQTQPIRKGSLVLLRPGDAHAFNATSSGGMLVANIAFAVDTLEYFQQRYPSAAIDLWKAEEPLPVLMQVSSLDLEWLKAEVDWLSQGARSQLQIDRFLLNIASKLGRQNPQNNGHPIPVWLEKALLAIEEPENFKGGTPALARLAGRSPEHVARVIRSALGKKPTDVVNAARMRYTAHRLAMSEAGIQDLATDCGFESLGHFYQCFRMAYGMSPHRYRRRQRGLQ